MKTFPSRSSSFLKVSFASLVALSSFLPWGTMSSAVLVQYDFQATFANNNSVSATSTASTVGVDVTASAFATNGMIALRSTSAPSSASNASFAVTTAQVGGSINLDEYLSFSLNATAGNFLNLTSLAFQVANAGAAPLPDGRWQVRSSVDSFSADLGTFSSTTTTATFESKSVDLSGAAFQNLSSIAFRIYLWDDDNTNSGLKALRTDTVTVEGAVVPIPEPASWVLLAGGVSLVVVLRRRKKS